MTRNTTISRDALEARLRDNVFTGGYREEELAESVADDVFEVFGALPWLIDGDAFVAAGVSIPLESMYSALHATTIGGFRPAIRRVIGDALRAAGYVSTWVKVVP